MTNTRRVTTCSQTGDPRESSGSGLSEEPLEDTVQRNIRQSHTPPNGREPNPSFFEDGQACFATETDQEDAASRQTGGSINATNCLISVRKGIRNSGWEMSVRHGRKNVYISTADLKWALSFAHELIAGASSELRTEGV